MILTAALKKPHKTKNYHLKSLGSAVATDLCIAYFPRVGSFLVALFWGF
jgi:hypothetical protein